MDSIVSQIMAGDDTARETIRSLLFARAVEAIKEARVATASQLLAFDAEDEDEDEDEEGKDDSSDDEEESDGDEEDKA